MANLPQPNKFKYDLIIGTTSYTLIQSPIGWEENLINYKRDNTYNGILRSYTVPLEFVTEGAKILRSQYYQYGIEAFVRIEIFELNSSTWVYESIFLGELDFSTCEDGKDTFTISVMEGGITQKIKAYATTKFDINLLDGIDVTIPGIGLNDYSNSISEAGVLSNTYPAIDLVINQLLSGKVTAQNTIRSSNADSENWFAKSNFSGLIRINGKLRWTTIGGIREILLIGDYGSGSVLLKSIYKGSGFIDFDFDFNLITALNLKLYIRTIGGTVDIDSMSINISYSIVTDPINCKMLKPKYLLEQILRKINGNNDVIVRSNLLDNSTVCLTSGSGIRGLTGAKIKTTFKDFFQSINAVYGIGIGIENGVFVLEKLSYFYTDIVTSASLGNVKECTFEPAKDYFATNIKSGYKDQEYQEVNGLDEFNSSQEYTTPISRITDKTLDLMSTYRADVRGIEEIRKKLLITDATTTDIDSDNDTFMIKLKPDFSAPESIEAFISVSGIDNPELMYNMDLSPKRNLLRNSPFLASILSNLTGTLIRFQSAAKNANLATTDLSGLYVKESDNIEIDTLNGRLFYPIIVNFKTDAPVNLQKLIKTNPYGAITFNWFGNTYRGFVLEVSQDVSKNSEQEFKLLLSASNDITKLVR